MVSNADMRDTGAAMCIILPWAGRTEMLSLTGEMHTDNGDCNASLLKSRIHRDWRLWDDSVRVHNPSNLPAWNRRLRRWAKEDLGWGRDASSGKTLFPPT